MSPRRRRDGVPPRIQMLQTSQNTKHADEREPYTTPELTHHGSLEELTQGAGRKFTEKGSGAESTGFVK
jgi:hypothetical protein